MEKNTGEDIRDDEKQVKKSTALTSFLILALIFFLGVGGWIYFFGPNNLIVGKIASVIPYPAAIADNKNITAYRLQKNLDAAVKFYQNQDFSDAGLRVDFSTSDGKKRQKIKERRILTKMAEDAIIEQEARRRNIKLTNEEVSAEVEKKLKQLGDQESLQNNLKKLYGWDRKDFEENIVKPDLYAQRLYADIRANDAEFSKALAKIKEAKAELDKSKDFELVVGKYSEGDSVKNRGDLGWFSAEEMLPEIAMAAAQLEKGKTSDIIESGLGYHIIRVEEKKTENGTDKFHIRQIFVRVPTLAQWLAQKEKEVRIFSLRRGYQWNENIGEMQFTDESLKKFEDNLEKNSPDDVSVFF
jgi:parvulin-like peptidyl-prolyl isomerase